EGTVVVICVDETTVNDAALPPKSTPVAPENPLPVIVTAVPTVPFAGEKELTSSVATTESWAIPLADPSVPVTVYVPGCGAPHAFPVHVPPPSIVKTVCPVTSPM